MVRGKFYVSKVSKLGYPGNLSTQVEVTLSAQYDDGIEENKRFCKATPMGTITMFIDNPSAVEYLELGKAFYVDFTAVA